MDLYASISGMNAAALGVAATANNIANLQSKDFRAQRVDLQDREAGGVEIADLRESQELGAPEGSNVDMATEMTNLMTQSTTYEANLKALKVQDQLIGQTLNLFT